MKRKTGIVALLVILIASVLLAACGGENGGSNGSESPSGPSASAAGSGQQATGEQPKDVDLKILNFRVEDKAFFDEMNKKFEEENPHIHVKYDVVPTADYWQLVSARLTTGDADLLGSGGEQDIKNPVYQNTLADMSGQPFLDRFLPDALKAGQKDGQQLFLPFSNIFIVVFYNKQIFQELGLNVPATWDEFVAVSEAIKAAGRDPIMFGGKDQWPVNMVIDGLEQSIVRGPDPDFYDRMATEETKFTDPKWIEVLTKLQKISGYFQKNSAGLDYAQAPALFAQGKAAMMIDGSWSLAQIEDAQPSFEVGTFLLPGTNDPEMNKVASTKFGFGWVMNSQSPNQEAAFKYLEFLSRPDNYQKYVDMVRMLPVVKEVETKSQIAKEASALLQNQSQLWESLLIPGAKYTYTEQGMKLVLNATTPEKAAETMQKDLIGSKDAWQQ